MAAWSRKTLNKIIFAFLERKNPYWENFPRHRSMCCIQISWNSAQGKSVKSRFAYLTKFFLLSSPGLATAPFAPNICQDQPQTMYSECSRFHPKQFTFGGVIPERVNTIIMGRKVFPIFSRSLASSLIVTSVNSLTQNIWTRKAVVGINSMHPKLRSHVLNFWLPAPKGRKMAVKMWVF